MYLGYLNHTMQRWSLTGTYARVWFHETVSVGPWLMTFECDYVWNSVSARHRALLSQNMLVACVVWPAENSDAVWACFVQHENITVSDVRQEMKLWQESAWQFVSKALKLCRIHLLFMILTESALTVATLHFLKLKLEFDSEILDAVCSIDQLNRFI
jgi:hypothetical protein